MSRTFAIKPVKPKFGRVAFPTDQLLALYIRLSKGEQAEDIHESFRMQTEGLQQIALDDLRWNPDKVLKPFIENQQKEDGRWGNASGTKRIDDRPVLHDVQLRIMNDEIKAILVWLVDRLFRDEEGAEAPAFARICKEHGVMLFTSAGEWFDFTNPRDYKRFLDEANAAAEFISHNLRERAHPARKEVSRRGEYDGRGVPVGFYVEQKAYRKKFASKEPRFFLEYKEHADVVRWIFRRYRELNGNFAALCREIAVLPFVFPFFPKGMYVPPIHLSHNEYGYTISDNGLKGLLCNPAYIGWWYVAGEPVRKDNHLALVDEGDFWYAFDRMSKYTIDGQPREQLPERARYNKVGTEPCDALLNGIISGDGLPVYVIQYATKDWGAYYTITNPKKKFGNRRLGSLSVERLDRLFTDHLLAKLEEGKRLRRSVGPEWENEAHYFENILAMRFINAAQTQQDAGKGIDAQLLEYKEKAASLDKTLQFGAAKLSPKKIEEYSEKLTKYLRSIDQLETKKNRAEIAALELAKFVTRLDDIPAAWGGMTVANRRSFIEMVTERVTLTRIAPNWLLLEVIWSFYDEWNQSPRSRCYILQQQGSGDVWSEEEERTLRKLYPSADRATILDALPTRSWSSITDRSARNLKLSRSYQLNNATLHPSVSVEDDRFMQQMGFTYEEGDRAWWILDDYNEGTCL